MKRELKRKGGITLLLYFGILKEILGKTLDNRNNDTIYKPRKVLIRLKV